MSVNVAKMIVEEIIVTPFAQNARVIGCAETKQAICVDPGEASAEILEAIRKHGFELQAIWLTHAHLDHIGGVSWLKGEFPDAEIVLHADDLKLYESLPRQPEALGIPREQWAALGLEYEQPPKVERLWQEGETWAVGKLNFEIIHTPGHAPGHVVMFERSERVLIGGDCLFAGSIGRTDLPGGSMEVLMDSIRNKILPLGDDVLVLTGHGDTTSIGRERRTNPFLTGVYGL